MLTYKKMKSNYFIKSKLNRVPLIALISFAYFAIALSFAASNLFAQQPNLSLADILIGLRSKKVTLDERNQLLAGAVVERGITFSLTPEIEKELEITGAAAELIAAIKQKSAFALQTAKLEQKSMPTISAPTPAQAEPDSAFYKKQADEQASKGETDAALMNYEKAIGLNPKNHSIYLNRALLYLKNKNYELAIADYDQVVKLDPKNLIAHSNRANSYEKIGKVENAVNDYKTILEIDGKNEAALNNLKRIEDDRARELQNRQGTAESLQAENSKDKKAADPKMIAEVPVNAAPSTSDASQVLDIGRITPLMAINLVTPVYSQSAKTLNLKGQVTVEVTINESGNVDSVKSTEGHRLLRESAEQAVKRSKFKPAMVDGKAVKSKGYIVYSFVR